MADNSNHRPQILTEEYGVNVSLPPPLEDSLPLSPDAKSH